MSLEGNFGMGVAVGKALFSVCPSIKGCSALLASAKAWGGGALALVAGMGGKATQACRGGWVATGTWAGGSSQTAACALSGWAYWTACSWADLTGD